MSWFRRARPPSAPEPDGLPVAEVARLRARIEQEREALLGRPLDDSTRGALEEIAYALVRIEDGTYGTCAGCRLPIPLGTLDEAPATRYCPPCRGARRPSG